jgi:hypothetical protein
LGHRRRSLPTAETPALAPVSDIDCQPPRSLSGHELPPECLSGLLYLMIADDSQFDGVEPRPAVCAGFGWTDRCKAVSRSDNPSQPLCGGTSIADLRCADEYGGFVLILAVCVFETRGRGARAIRKPFWSRKISEGAMISALLRVRHCPSLCVCSI